MADAAQLRPEADAISLRSTRAAERIYVGLSMGNATVRLSVADFCHHPPLPVIVNQFLIWFGLIILVIGGFVDALGPLRWVPIGALALMGGFIAFVNWTIVWAEIRGREAPSMVPLLGGLLLLLAMLASPIGWTHRCAPVALLVDPFLAAQLFQLGSLNRRRR